jgi:hypothetical protein
MANDGKIIVADAFKHLDPNQSLADGIGSGFSRIGIKGKNWSLFHQGEKYLFVRDDDGTPLPYLDVIIVGVNPKISKMYFGDKEYQDDSQEAPICTAVDVGTGPDAGSPEPQAKSCGVCVHNEWLPNKGGKECQDHKRVAVLLLPYMKTKPALDAPLLEPVYFKVPPASLKPWKAYADSLNHRGAHFASVVTRITFEPGKLFQMNFAFKQPLTNAEAPLVLPMLEDMQTRNLIGTIPIVREIGPPAIPKEKEEAQDTGLMAAFGKTGTVTNLPTPKRGRPAKPKPVDIDPEDAPEQQRANDGAESEGVEESDSDLDSAVQNVMSKKLSDMLK